ncbi:hypothetical protein F0L68_04245 [Solihabitans fulvus]|uniref:Condensation domain-containing protein n=1 Tax=Solihabitans fulvus TaxID=1892852 RepID=A0A5B2XPW1_9PSEU|nr:condensation domain-containing protein [Solihabitans fulvus]KAA2265777.1 hypothetical protein F0L68_04245 [Solihabitans fulvus]
MTTVQSSRASEWPATPIQRWITAQDQAVPQSGYWVLPFTWTVDGQVDWPAFTRAFEAICDRYPVLLAATRRRADGWVQEVQPFADVPMQLRDATGLAGKERDQFLLARYEEYCRTPFNLAEQPPIRVLVIQLDSEFLVFGAYHQTVCDIESMAIFIAEFTSLYESFTLGRQPDLPPVTMDFATYAASVVPSSRQREVDNIAFWRERLRDQRLEYPLPVDYPDGVRNPVGPTAYVKIGAQATALAVHAIATENRCSEYAVLLSVFAFVLAKRSGQPSIVLSCPISRRRSPDLFGVFGPLTDMTWLRVDVRDTLRETIQPTFHAILESLSRPCPIDLLTGEAPDGESGLPAGPNIQSQFFPPERVANPDWVTSSVKVKDVMPVYLLTGPLHSPFWLDLTIAGERKQPDTDFSLVYRCDLFHPDTVRALAAEIEQCVLDYPTQARSS